MKPNTTESPDRRRLPDAARYAAGTSVVISGPGIYQGQIGTVIAHSHIAYSVLLSVGERGFIESELSPHNAPHQPRAEEI